MGISGSGSGRRGRRRNGWISPQSLQRHFDDHGQSSRDQINAPDRDAYHQGAWDNIFDPDTVRGIRPRDRARGYFNRRTGHLTITNARGRKTNFMRPTSDTFFDRNFPGRNLGRE